MHAPVRKTTCEVDERAAVRERSCLGRHARIGWRSAKNPAEASPDRTETFHLGSARFGAGNANAVAFDVGPGKISFYTCDPRSILTVVAKAATALLTADVITAI